MFERFSFFNTKRKSELQALGFAVVGVVGVVIVDRLSIDLIRTKENTYGLPLLIGILFFLLSALFLYSLLRKTAKVAEDALIRLSEYQRQEQERLQLFNFALDHSADAIYWFTFDTRFFYVNDAACTMLGYTKEELLNMSLESVDRAFPTEQGQRFLRTIQERKKLRFERIQTRKDGSSFPAEISANYFCGTEQEFICAFGRDITEQKEKEKIITDKNAALKSSLQDKEALIKEIHHRVKNNLEVISSLLQMQSRREADPYVREALSKSQSRIYSIALVHEMLYKNSGLATINMKDHLQRLADAMIDLYEQSRPIRVEMDAENVMLSMDNAVLVALIVHELFLNSMKHAFTGTEGGTIRIFIRHSDEGAIEFGVSDDGIGFDPERVDTSNTLGCQLINTITEFQLNGTITLEGKNGFCCTIRFTPNEKGEA